MLGARLLAINKAGRTSSHLRVLAGKMRRRSTRDLQPANLARSAQLNLQSALRHLHLGQRIISTQQSARVRAKHAKNTLLVRREA